MRTARIYVGDLGDRGTSRELETEFGRYGTVTDVWVARNPPGFAFVLMESRLDADEAVRNLDGAHVCGVRIKVEIAKGAERGSRDRDSREHRSIRSTDTKCFECGRNGHAARDCTRRPGYVYQGHNSSSRRRSRSRSPSRSRDVNLRKRNDLRERRRSRSRSFERRPSRSPEPPNNYGSRSRNSRQDRNDHMS